MGTIGSSGSLFSWAAFYLLTPLITYSTLRQDADPDLVPIDPTQTQLPQAVQNYFDRVEQALRPCGFTLRVGDIALPNQVPNVAANLRFFVNQETADTASCTAVYAHASGTWTMRSRYVQFSTCYHDESVSFTSNCEVASVFPGAARPRQSHHAGEEPGPALRRPSLDHARALADPEENAPLDRPIQRRRRGLSTLAVDRRIERRRRGRLLIPVRVAARLSRHAAWGLPDDVETPPPFKQIQLLKRKRKADRILAEMRRDANQSS